MSKNKKPFEHFDSEDYQDYQNRLLIRVLEVRLAQKGELTPDDIIRAYEQCRVLIQQDIEFLAKKWCLFWNSRDQSVDPSKCCLVQLVDGEDLQRDAVELVYKMKPSFLWRIYNQPKDKRLQIRAHLIIVFTVRSQCVEITSGDISTFPGLFLVLLEEMNAIDEGMDGEDFKLKPALEYLLREVGPRIALKLKKYYDHPSLGYKECQFCNSHWVEKPNKPDIKNLSNLPCFKTPRELEQFLALSFRRMFYTELLHYITDNFPISDLSDDGFEN